LSGTKIFEGRPQSQGCRQVLLDVTVTTDGEVKNPTVIKSPGYGLEEKAMEKVVTWKMKPALGPDGQPVTCRVQIEVTFHFYPNG